MACTSNLDSSQTTLFRDVRTMRDVYGMGFNLGYNGHTVALEYKNGTKYSPIECFFDLKLQAASQLKPFLGRKYADEEFQAHRKFFCLEVSEGPYGYPLFHCENKCFTASQILSYLFSYLNSRWTPYKNNDSCVGWCIGIPMYYTDLQRRLLLDAANQAGLNSVKLIHELTATALAYKISYIDLPKYDKLNMAFVDMGATSMQVCIFQLTKDGLKVLSQAFDSSLGGRNFDRVLINHFTSKCTEVFGPEVHENSRFQNRLHDVCEKIKHELSVNTESFYDIRFASRGNGSHTLYMKREEFVRMSAPLLERVKGPLEKALSESGLVVEDIHCVESVGLGSRIPEIIKIIRNVFGKEPKETMEGKKLAAFGCARRSTELFKTSNIKVQDSIPYAIAMSWEKKKGVGKNKTVLFPKRSPIPSTEDWIFQDNRTFYVQFVYVDTGDLQIPTIIKTYKIGPFPQSSGGIVSVKTRIQLNEDGIISVERASIDLWEEGKEETIPVSKLFELKFEGTLSLLKTEVENWMEIKVEFAKKKTVFENHELLENYYCKMPSKLKWRAYHELQSKITNKELTDTSLQFNALKSFLSAETKNRNKAEKQLARTQEQLEEQGKMQEKLRNELNAVKSMLSAEKQNKTKELANAILELENQEKLHQKMVNEVKNKMYEESHFRQKADEELAYERSVLTRVQKLYDEKLHENEMCKAENEVLKEKMRVFIEENEMLKEKRGVLQEENVMLKVQNGVLKEQNEELKLQNIVLQEENGIFKSENEVSKEVNGVLKEENGVLKELNRVLKQENEVLKEENGGLQTNNRVLKEDNEVLKINNEVLKKENGSLKANNEVLNKENDVLKLENGMLKAENDELKCKEDNIVKRFEEFRQWMVEQLSSSSTIGMVNFSEFTYPEIEESTNNFDQKLKIGEGGYGCVYKASLRCTKVAIKIPKPESKYGQKEFNQEVEILSRIRHPNIVTLIGACTEAFALVYELVQNGSLEDHLNHLKNGVNLPWKTRICIASDICSALIFLHSSKPHGIVHGDLKPANILLDSNYQAKITDFGLSRQLALTSETITPHHYTDCPKGTLYYMDPEYFPSGKLTPQFDVYSFGIVLLQLVTRKEVKGIRRLVDGAIKKGRLDKIVDPSGKWPLEVAKRMALLGLRCSELNRVDRPDLKVEAWSEIESMNHVGSSRNLRIR